MTPANDILFYLFRKSLFGNLKRMSNTHFTSTFSFHSFIFLFNPLCSMVEEYCYSSFKKYYIFARTKKFRYKNITEALKEKSMNKSLFWLLSLLLRGLSLLITFFQLFSSVENMSLSLKSLFCI